MDSTVTYGPAPPLRTPPCPCLSLGARGQCTSPSHPSSMITGLGLQLPKMRFFFSTIRVCVHTQPGGDVGTKSFTYARGLMSLPGTCAAVPGQTPHYTGPSAGPAVTPSSLPLLSKPGSSQDKQLWFMSNPWNSGFLLELKRCPNS